MVKIFLDAGHGGSDPGAIGNGLKEKDINLAIVLQLQQILNHEYQGHSIKLSRSTDQTLSLKQRTGMANQWGADYLVSIHINAGGGTGFESYTYNGKYPWKSKTNQLRAAIHNEIVRVTGFRDRSKKEANFHMLRESTMSALLTESGFIDHQIDSARLKSRAFLNKIALGHAKGLAKALNLPVKSGNIASPRHFYTIRKGDTLWSLAQKHGTTVNELLELNHGIKPRYLQIGQEIRMK